VEYLVRSASPLSSLAHPEFTRKSAIIALYCGPVFSEGFSAHCWSSLIPSVFPGRGRPVSFFFRQVTHKTNSQRGYYAVIQRRGAIHVHEIPLRWADAKRSGLPRIKMYPNTTAMRRTQGKTATNCRQLQQATLFDSTARKRGLRVLDVGKQRA